MYLRGCTILLLITEIFCSYDCSRKDGTTKLRVSTKRYVNGNINKKEQIRHFIKTADRNNYTIYDGDIIELTCYKYIDKCDPANVTWEIMQHETTLITINDNTKCGGINITVDSYDDNLLVACTEGNKKNETVTIKFVVRGEKRKNNTNNDISEVPEGKPVLNDYERPAILYDSGVFVKIIENGQNIYDAVTENNTLNSKYSIWAKSGETPHISKKWFKHHVKTNNLNKKDNIMKPNTTLPFALAGAVIVLHVVVFLSIYVYKKCCDRKETVNELYEEYHEHVYEEPNLLPQVLYTEVALQTPEKPAPPRIEAPYTTIVGKMVKKKPPPLPIRNEPLQTRTGSEYA